MRFAPLGLLLLAASPAVARGIYARQNRCRCRPTDPCWPSPQDWSALNTATNGALVPLRPVAAPCHDPDYDPAACQVVAASYTSAQWRSDQPGALQSINWETWPQGNETCLLESPRDSACQQGRIPLYSVVATAASHIQEAVRFAAKRNLRLVIRNTGHDWLGRSAARDSFQIFTHRLKDITFTDNFVPKNCPKNKDCGGGPAVTIGAGVQMIELYQAAKARGQTVVSGGGGSTVGAAGGYIQGGGHSLLANLHGAPTDNVLEFTVVTAAGDHVTANEMINPDLFWALRGGGGGTFGVVTSVTMRTFSDPPTVTVNLNITLPAADQYWTAVRDLQRLLPRVDDAGGSGFFYLFPNLGAPAAGSQLLAGFFFAGQTDAAPITALFEPFLAAARAVPGSAVGAQVAPVPAFSDAQIPLLRQTDTTPPITVFGSRLVSRAFLASDAGPQRVADTLRSLRQPPGLAVIGLAVAGGQVARNAGAVDSALNPAWRAALLHLQLLRGWPALAPPEQQARVLRNLTDVEVPLLRALEGADAMGAYGNEADPGEPQWQRSFWGANYARLLAVKRKWDPDTLFVCRRCVGSERWEQADGLCPQAAST